MIYNITVYFKNFNRYLLSLHYVPRDVHETWIKWTRCKIPAPSDFIIELKCDNLFLKSLAQFQVCCSCFGFPGSSADKESAYNAGDSGSILGPGRSPGKGIGYPLQYSWDFLVAQTVKNLPAIQETCVGKIWN